MERALTIPTQGGMHNTYVTPDGKHVLSGATGGQHLLIIDAKTDEPLWRIFDRGVRPIAIEKKPDGSTNRLFVQLTNLHGFAVVDFCDTQGRARNYASGSAALGQGREQRCAIARHWDLTRRQNALG
jgi:hypothetical protein